MVPVALAKQPSVSYTHGLLVTLRLNVALAQDKLETNPTVSCFDNLQVSLFLCDAQNNLILTYPYMVSGTCRSGWGGIQGNYVNYYIHTYIPRYIIKDQITHTGTNLYISSQVHLNWFGILFSQFFPK